MYEWYRAYFLRFAPRPRDQLSARELAMLPRTLPISSPAPVTYTMANLDWLFRSMEQKDQQ
ncbi:hypothetical protein PYCCODRAFT_1435996 [Trametes coccinea BRFM310]|uniref:Uncharacterized protein n=1 Tax=Trametes coccinea (strain BRFM310) TaxID=1353009 RepID=A0A1Y2IM61_TRAC3|nr:hypothetical protein PYCCODRAFT_1435996 [Trametes coccinea BRFM310]